MNIVDFAYIAPILMLGVFGLVVLVLGTIADRFPKGRLNHLLPPDYLSAALMVPTVLLSGAALWTAMRFGARPFFELLPTQHPLILMDPFAAFFGLIAVIGTFAVIIMSLDYFTESTRHRTEYFSLLLFATCAILLVAASTDMLMIYLSIEFLSLSSYVLVSYWKTNSKSSEAGIKYFLFGALSSAVMLYGMSMLYGLVGSTNLAAIAGTLGKGQVLSIPAVWIAVIMVLAGLGFKLALVPFHLWAPDTYEGAPTPITAWLSVASKAAGLAVVTRFLLVAVPIGSGVDWYTVLIVLAAASMTLGNLVAISQNNIKRMLAYSSIAQVGYMLIGVLAAATAHDSLPAVRAGYLAVSVETHGAANYGLAGLLIYAASYLFMNLGAFAVVIAVERKLGSSEIEDYSGLMKRAPFLAGSLVVFFLSLAGVPPTAGFLGKALVFAGAIQTGQTDMLTLAIIGIANSVISIYYYFNVVRLMFMQEPTSEEPVTASRPMTATVAVMLFMTIALLVAAMPLWKLVTAALS